MSLPAAPGLQAALPFVDSAIMIPAESGSRGERAAAEYLRRRGYEVVAVNWRDGRYELDIVARKCGVVHFVEVKTRLRGGLTAPEEAMTFRKRTALRRAVEAYLSYTGWAGEIQMDLIAVEYLPEGECRVRMIENAVEYNW